MPNKNGRLDLDALKAALNDDVASLILQSPNYFGVIEDVPAIARARPRGGRKARREHEPHRDGAAALAPARCGADVAIGDGQPLGIPLSFGGPYLGFMACKKDMMRKLPGRIVGQTTDAQGRRCFVLTLQAREQHIRREKASSNICSNQALCALTAAAYCSAMGPQGLARSRPRLL